MVIDSITVPTSATRLSTLSPKLAGVIAKSMVLQANSTNSTNVIYVGNSDVATTEGYELQAGGVLSIQAPDSMDLVPGSLWVIASTGTPRLNIVVQEQ